MNTYASKTHMYLQNAVHYLNETWRAYIGDVAAITWNCSLSAIPQGRYGAKFMEHSITRCFSKNGSATKACITETERERAKVLLRA